MRLHYSTNRSCLKCNNTINNKKQNTRDQAFARRKILASTSNNYLIAFEEQYAVQRWALKVQRNYKIFTEALEKLKIIVSGIAGESGIALEILPSLKYKEMSLLSCAYTPERKPERLAHFAREYTTLNSGSWTREDIMDIWDKLHMVGLALYILE